LVPEVICALLRGKEARCTQGDQVRDFLHVADVASAFVLIVESQTAGVVNIGSGEPVLVRTIVDAIAGEVGARNLVRLGALSYPAGEQPLVVAANGRLRDLGWARSYTLSRGIAETVAWWRTAAGRSEP
jgi:nucleoside-diphosphate-sugar epimerase